MAGETFSDNSDRDVISPGNLVNHEFSEGSSR